MKAQARRQEEIMTKETERLEKQVMKQEDMLRKICDMLELQAKATACPPTQARTITAEIHMNPDEIVTEEDYSEHLWAAADVPNECQHHQERPRAADYVLLGVGMPLARDNQSTFGGVRA